MNQFTYYAPTKIYFGNGLAANIGRYTKEAGARKVLLHYGGSSAEKSGLLDTVRKSLAEAELSWVELGGVKPNPRLSLVREGAALCLRENVDFLLAVGGGSVIDSAKAIGYALGEPDRDVWELFTKKRQPKEGPPLGAVLTIAASGSEMSNSCVITNDETWEKRGCKSDSCRPDFAVLDPLLTLTLPHYQTMSGCADILMHTMERYFTSHGNMELTDALAEGLLRTVMRHTLILKNDPGNLDSRAEVMWAGSLSHNGLMSCGNGGDDFATHGIEHELSGFFDVTHGAGLCAIWPSWARYVVGDCTHRFERFALNVMGVKPEDTPLQTAMKGIDAAESFFRSIDMPVTLKELGIDATDEVIDRMCASWVRAYGGKRGSARVLFEEDVRRICRMAKE